MYRRCMLSGYLFFRAGVSDWNVSKWNIHGGVLWSPEIEHIRGRAGRGDVGNGMYRETGDVVMAPGSPPD